MLPSKAIRTLCKEHIVAVARWDDPECAELRREFAVPFLNSWIVVLDGKGETLASLMGDVAGTGCTERSAETFPRNLATFIRKSLERVETVEELERRWRKRPRDMERFEAFARRLEEMHAYGKLRQHCQDALANPALSPLQRDEFRIRAFDARASDHTEDLSTRKARTQFVRDGEKLLVELAGHPKAAGLVGALFARGYAHTFDVPGKSGRAIARLERALRQAVDVAALKDRIQELAQMREEWIKATTEALQRITQQSSKRHLAALLGDARAAIKLCSRPPHREHPQFREWLREAKQKLERERKLPPAR